MTASEKMVRNDGHAENIYAVAAEARSDRERFHRDRYTVGRWTVEVTETDAPTRFGYMPPPERRWHVGIYYGTYSGSRTFAGATREEAEAKMREYLAPRELRLDPLDVGFDLRATRTPIVVPISGEITIHLPRSKRHPEGRIEGPLTSGWARSMLRQYGFMVAGDGPTPPAPGLDANGAMIED